MFFVVAPLGVVIETVTASRVFLSLCSRVITLREVPVFCVIVAERLVLVGASR